MVWRPLKPAKAIHDEAKADALVREMRNKHGIDEPTARRLIAEARSVEIWKNDMIQAAVRRDPEGGVHISFHRLDRKPIRDWRTMQRIKNELLGRECEAVELFPAESRLVDTANEYHLWGSSDPSFRFPIGFNDGRRIDSTPDPATGAVQRPISEEIVE